ncbi:cysteine-rich receptor-like protein kinase 10 [Quercus suber]|uniref:Cysteine-rich receptor-like protein kinase 10 n=1 Tax=Quercus suber TaxID=58331 RepID=A0AAW0KUP3_QUESU
MDKDVVSANLFLIIPLFMPLIFASAELLDIFCPNDSGSYTLYSPFENNLKQLLESLPSNTSVTVCQTCIWNASQEILTQCKSEDAMIWFELCQVRYSYQMFFSLMDYTVKYLNNLGQNSSDPVLAVHYNEVLAYLFNNISTEASNDPSKRMFITGEIKLSTETIYGLVQCTRDISEDDCYYSLKRRNRMVVVITCVPLLVLAVLGGSCAVYHRRKKRTQTGPTGVEITEDGELAWRLWKEGKGLEFIDPLLMESAQTIEVLKCMHIGLLCVQEDPADRPTMTSVAVLLGNESVPLPEPKHPALAISRLIQIDQLSAANPSVNELTLSNVSPR